MVPMPRTKKAAGTAVDSRNGRRLELAAAVPLAKFGLPKRAAPAPAECEDCGAPQPAGPGWQPETRKAWAAMWADPVSALLSVADRPVLLRWADAIDRAAWALRRADAQPVANGSMGQPVENPLYGVADKALRVAQACEAQIGVGALNRARLGLEFTSAQKSLQELNAALMGGDDEPDPRDS